MCGTPPNDPLNVDDEEIIHFPFVERRLWSLENLLNPVINHFISVPRLPAALMRAIKDRPGDTME